LRKTRSLLRAAQLPRRPQFSSGFGVSSAVSCRYRAAVSVFPHRSSAASSGPLLSGADGKPISDWGKVTKKLNLGLHTFIVSFILAAVSKRFLGIDFLSAHRLLVDPFSRAVLFTLSLEPVGRTVAADPLRFSASISHIVLLSAPSWHRFPASSATAKVPHGHATTSAIC
jgi:hypothetical protein